MVYFNLSPTIYAAQCDDAIIILDSTNDNYISLIDDAALYLPIILSQSFVYDTDTETFTPTTGDDEQVSYWVSFFIEQQFIVASDEPKVKSVSPGPLQSGGLSEYQWDMKKSWRPFKHARVWDIAQAFVVLARVHRRMKRQGIQGIIDLINATHKIPAQAEPSSQAIEQLIHAIDAASLMYPKKTFCLAWAATFVVMARTKGWKSAQLVVGIQATPFYAHAWAEMNGTVIHDDPIIADVLALIMKTPLGD